MNSVTENFAAMAFEAAEEIVAENEVNIVKKIVACGEVVEIPENLVKEIPYIETLLSGRFKISEEDGIVKSDEIDPFLLKVILKYLEKGRIYTLLASLPKENDVFQLFELFRFLAVKPPVCIKKSSIKKRLLNPPRIGLNSQEDLVKFSFTVFYAYNLLNYRSENKVRNNVFNTMNYIFDVNHVSFKPRAKFHLLKLVKSCVRFSYNQFQKIKTLKVEDDLETSDCESVHSIDTDGEDDWFDDCYEYVVYDSDNNILEDDFFGDLYHNWYDNFDPDFYSDDSDDSIDLNIDLNEV